MLNLLALMRDLLDKHPLRVALAMLVWLQVSILYGSKHWVWMAVALFPTFICLHRGVHRKLAKDVASDIYPAAFALWIFIFVLHSITGGALRLPQPEGYFGAGEVTNIGYLEDRNGVEHRHMNMSAGLLHSKQNCPDVVPADTPIGDSDYKYLRKYFTLDAGVLAGHTTCYRCLHTQYVEDVPVLLGASDWRLADRLAWVPRIIVAMLLEVLHQFVVGYLLPLGVLAILVRGLRYVLRPS